MWTFLIARCRVVDDMLMPVPLSKTISHPFIVNGSASLPEPPVTPLAAVRSELPVIVMVSWFVMWADEFDGMMLIEKRAERTSTVPMTSAENRGASATISTPVDFLGAARYMRFTWFQR